ADLAAMKVEDHALSPGSQERQVELSWQERGAEVQVEDVVARPPPDERRGHGGTAREAAGQAIELDHEVGTAAVPIHAVGQRARLAAQAREPPRQHHPLPGDLVGAVEDAQRPPAVAGQGMVAHPTAYSPGLTR